jgi:hypothetical protein
LKEASPQTDVGAEPAEPGDPERDRVVDEHRGGGVCRCDAIEGERPSQAGVEYADPAGYRQRIRQVADVVGEDQRRELWRGSERSEHDPQHRDVEAQVAERAREPPAGMFAERRLLGVLNAGADSANPPREPTPGTCEQRHRGDRQRRGEDEHSRQPGPREVVRAAYAASQRQPRPDHG